jgi:hypothetical protein
MTEPAWATWWKNAEENDILGWEDECGPRRRRLFVVACCRRLLPLLVDERSRDAIEVSERYAESLATDKKLRAAKEAAELAARDVEDSDLFTDRQRAAARVTAAWVAASDAVLMDSNLNPTGYVMDVMGPGEGSVQWGYWLDLYGPGPPTPCPLIPSGWPGMAGRALGWHNKSMRVWPSTGCRR